MPFYALPAIVPVAVVPAILLILGGLSVVLFKRSPRDENSLLDMLLPACASLFLLWYLGFHAAQQVGSDLVANLSPAQWIP